MEKIKRVIRGMIAAHDKDIDAFIGGCYVQQLKKKEIVCPAGKIPQEIYFINQGLIRLLFEDPNGVDHTVHFAMEDLFIAEYSAYLQYKPAFYALQALEDTEVVVLPRKHVDWAYQNIRNGDRMGRLIAEYYFMQMDAKIRNIYFSTPADRYRDITELFPDIHNRVPQHMIASYLGITPVHLSRLKKKQYRET